MLEAVFVLSAIGFGFFSGNALTNWRIITNESPRAKNVLAAWIAICCCAICCSVAAAVIIWQSLLIALLIGLWPIVFLLVGTVGPKRFIRTRYYAESVSRESMTDED